jgi:hypothetical protein
MMEGMASLFINITSGTQLHTDAIKKVVHKVKRITGVDCHRSVMMQWPLQLYVFVQRLDVMIRFIEFIEYACSR